MAGGAGADGAVRVGPADAVALDAAGADGRRAFQGGQRVGRPFARTGVVLFAEGNLLGAEILVAVNRRPGRRGVAAAQELLIDRLMARAAVARRQPRGDDEAVMVLLVLPLGRLMAIEAVDLLVVVDAHLIFVDDRVVHLGMALGTLARGADEDGAALLRHRRRPVGVHHEGRDDQTRRQDDGDEHGTKTHRIRLLGRCGESRRQGLAGFQFAGRCGFVATRISRIAVWSASDRWANSGLASLPVSTSWSRR